MRRPLELVIFDNDGVLVDSEPHAQRVTIALLTELGWPLSPDDCTERFLGRSMASICGLAEAHLGRALPADFEDRYHAGLFEAFATGLTPIPGVTGKLVVNAVLDAHPRAHVVWLPRRTDLIEYLARELRPGDVSISMGCGDIATLPDEVFSRRLELERGRS